MLYKHNGQIYDYSPLQIEQGFAKGVPLTEKEIEDFNKPKEPTQEEVQAQIKARLRELDALSARPMRAILHELLQHEEVIEVLEKTDNEETMKLSEYEKEAVYLREQLNASEKAVEENEVIYNELEAEIQAKREEIRGLEDER